MPVFATAQWAQLVGQHPASLRHRHARSDRARAGLHPTRRHRHHHRARARGRGRGKGHGRRRADHHQPTPADNHRRQIKHPPQNPGLDTPPIHHTLKHEEPSKPSRPPTGSTSPARPRCYRCAAPAPPIQARTASAAPSQSPRSFTSSAAHPHAGHPARASSSLDTRTLGDKQPPPLKFGTPAYDHGTATNCAPATRPR